MSEPLKEMAHFAGKACGTIVKDVAEFSQPLTEAFRQGWQEAMADQPKPKTESAPAADNHAAESA